MLRVSSWFEEFVVGKRRRQALSRSLSASWSLALPARSKPIGTGHGRH